jgi:hypothetical protein
VIVGYNTPQVLKFKKSVNLPEGTDLQGMLDAFLKISTYKSKRQDKRLPFDHSLGERMGIKATNPINGNNAIAAFIVAAFLYALWVGVHYLHQGNALNDLLIKAPFYLVPLLFLSLAIVSLLLFSLGAPSKPSDRPLILLWGILA